MRKTVKSCLRSLNCLRNRSSASSLLHFLVPSCKGATQHLESNTTFSHGYQRWSNLILYILKVEGAQGCIRTVTATYYKTQFLSQTLFTKHFPPATLIESLETVNLTMFWKSLKLAFAGSAFESKLQTRKQDDFRFLPVTFSPAPYSARECTRNPERSWFFLQIHNSNPTWTGHLREIIENLLITHSFYLSFPGKR